MTDDEKRERFKDRIVLEAPPYPAEVDDYTHQYLLPIEWDVILDSHQALVSPWFERFVGLAPIEVLALLQQDWDEVPAGAATSFVAQILSGQPTAVVVDRKQIWLGFQCGRFSEEHQPNADTKRYLMFAEPRTQSSAHQQLIGNHQDSCLAFFSEHFHTVFEALNPFVGGLMIRPSADSQALPKLGRWEKGIEIYSPCDGNDVLINISGEVGYWSLHHGCYETERECAVDLLADSFSDFIGSYVQYLQGKLGPNWIEEQLKNRP